MPKYKYKYRIYGEAEIGGCYIKIDKTVWANGPNQAFLFLRQKDLNKQFS